MSDTPVRVALLFDDETQAAPLRQALHDGGARIVHEGRLSGTSREALLQSDADVVVLNLHDEDALDGIEDMIDGERPRVVFNDAAASQRLDGWDRARWARHLAAKVLAQVDVDPPRPRDAPGLQPTLAPFAAQPAGETMPAPLPSAPTDTPSEEPSASLAAELEVLLAADQSAPQAAEDDSLSLSPLVLDDGESMMGDIALDKSATLADELAGLLAQDEDDFLAQEEVASDVGFDPGFLRDDEPLAFTEPSIELQEQSSLAEPAPLPPAPAVEPPRFSLDHLQLVSLEDASPAWTPGKATVVADDSVVRQAPAEWGLLDDDAPLSPPPASAPAAPPASSFGIEKMSATDFLAPAADDAPSPLRPGLSLELVSINEAIAPQPFERTRHHEMVLDPEASALRWLVVLGAAAEATPAVAAFLAALPASLSVLLVLTQHHRDSSALLRDLSANSALPVRLATHGSQASRGEVLLVPPGQSLSVRRDGRVELQPAADASPSIDASFSMAAQVFGAAALAIVFSGRGNDAVAGAQAVHDRGGRVWVEELAPAPVADMVRGVQAERLAGFAGTPAQLAARLSEEYSMEIHR